MNSRESLPYRADIDGLRAVAVVSVILYHAQITFLGRDWFEGGYLGVDIFFVISGYLIARIILVELNTTGSFSFMNFYERRARRILPVLLLVMLLSFIPAWFYLLPTAFVEFALSALSSLGFISNFYFYFATTEYGADSSLLKPLLHTWSLSVEEQFYLVFPVLMLLVFRRFGSRMAVPILILSLISLLLAQWIGVRDSELGFFLPFGRFWELAAGALLAMRELSDREPTGFARAGYAPFLGCCLLVGSLLVFDADTPHPGVYTLAPVVGVALIILYPDGKGFTRRVLGSRPLVLVGLISYSAYLWHFPLFAFARLTLEELTLTSKLTIIAATVVLSTVSYQLVEKPFRNRGLISSRRFVYLLLLAVGVSFAAGSAVVVKQGYESRFRKIEGFLNYEIDNQKLRAASWEILNKRQAVQPGFTVAANKVLIIGNSHAKDLFNALYQNRDLFVGFDFNRADISQLSCFNENMAVSGHVRDEFYNSDLYNDATLIIVSTMYNFKSRCLKRDKREEKTDDLEGLKFLLQRTHEDGKPIVLMSNRAEFRRFRKKWVADYIHSQHADGAYVDFDSIKTEADKLLYDRFSRRVGPMNSRIWQLALENGITYYDQISLACDREKQTCEAFTPAGYKTYYDYGHLTLEGAKRFGSKLHQAGFADLMLRIQGREDSH